MELVVWQLVLVALMVFAVLLVVLVVKLPVNILNS
jgi:hypothetical protein